MTPHGIILAAFVVAGCITAIASYISAARGARAHQDDVERRIAALAPLSNSRRPR